jgi:uric acid transporter
MTIPKASPQRPEDENLGVAANMAYGLQHVLTMYGGIEAVPLIVGQAAGLSPADIGLLIAASLFAGGLATLLQTLGLPFFGCQLPLVQGVSFAGVATMVAIVGSDGAGGIPAILGAVMAASLIGLLITPVFSRITKFFPPLVTGIVITTIGLTLMPVAARWAMGVEVDLARGELLHIPLSDQGGIFSDLGLYARKDRDLPMAVQAMAHLLSEEINLREHQETPSAPRIS